jgi:hypothetical protein
MLLAQQEVDPGWELKQQWIVPEHLLFPATDLNKKLKWIQHLHGHRLGAAHVASPFFLQALRIADGAPAESRRASTIDASIHSTIAQEDKREDWLTDKKINFKSRFPKDDHNFEHRVFRPSLPVLPISVALAAEIDESQEELRARPMEVQARFYRDMGGPQIDGIDFLTYPDLARRVILRAEKLERLIPYLPKPEIKYSVNLRFE